MSNKVKVALLCGGRSPEHNISLLSAQNVIRSVDTQKYELIIIGIDKKGQWMYYPKGLELKNENNPKLIELVPSLKNVVLSPNYGDPSIYVVDEHIRKVGFDVIFPILHGANGEDGSIQGFCHLAGVPCVGCGINGSVLSIDKDLMKKVLNQASIPVAKSFTLTNENLDEFAFAEASEKLGAKMYIKPARLGSSIGVSCVENEKEYREAVDLALQYDDKVLIEEAIVGREIECAVLGNKVPQASPIGEIIPQTDFYTFENKYVNADGALLAIPAELDESLMNKAQTLAKRAFLAMECEGMGRVDMFLKKDGTLLVNEINTIPGFTKISMYPKLWEYAGLNQEALISKLIELAIESYDCRQKLKHIA